MAEPTPLNKIRRPIFRKVSVTALVERLDPSRHDPQVTYEFSNRRTFKGKTDYE